MADDTRVTHSRSGFACALALLCALGCVLPAAARPPDIIVRRDPGLSADRARRRARRRGRAGSSGCSRCRTPSSSASRTRDEDAALAALNADPDVALRRARRRRARRRRRRRSSTSPLDRWTRSNDADIDGARGVGAAPGGRRRRRSRSSTRPIDASTPTCVGQRRRRRRGLRRRRRLRPPAPDRLRRPRHPRRGPRSRRCATTIGIAGVAPLRARAAAARDRQLRRRQARWTSSTAFEYAGEQRIPIVIGVVRAPTRCAGRTSADVDQPSPTSSTRYPDTLFVVAAGNEGNDNDERPVYPCNTLHGARRAEPASASA